MDGPLATPDSPIPRPNAVANESQTSAPATQKSFLIPRKTLIPSHPPSGVDDSSSAVTTLLPTLSNDESPDGRSPPPPNRPETKPMRKTRYPAGGWWWWEIAGCLVGVVGCVALVLLLRSIDKASRASWTHALEPNSVLAIISTISRSALMVPVGSCLSQLKWRHFRRPRQLSHLDMIDSSSRGPWGSFLLLTGIGTTNLLISLLAFTTIVSLAIGPTIQQILETDTREVKVADLTADIAYATNYTSMAGARALYGGTRAGVPHTAKEFDFISALARGLSDPIETAFSCPAERCSWPTFTTLGLCVKTENVARVNRTCGPLWQERGDDHGPLIGNYTWAINCTYGIPFHDSSIPRDLELDWVFRNITSGRSQMPEYTKQPQYLRTTAHSGTYDFHETKDGWNKTFRAKVLVAEVWATGPRPPERPAGAPDVHVHRSIFYFCAQTFSGVSATPASLSPEASMKTEALEAIGVFEDLSPPLIYLEYLTPSTGRFIWIERDTMDSVMPRLMLSWIKSASATSEADIVLTETSPGPWIWHHGAERAMNNIATSFSALIRNADLGENINATVFKGDAFRTEVYFNVRWPWISVVVAETLFITVLLAMSIWLSQKDSLVKDSAFALLIHGLEGWEPLRPPEPETNNSLGVMAKGMTARLEADEDGVLRFTRQPDSGGSRGTG